MLYDIASAQHMYELIPKVNALLEKGWRPLGPVVINNWFHQTLVKNVEQPEKQVRKRLTETAN